MAVQDDFVENRSGIFEAADDGTMDFEAFRRFAATNGAEQAKGYLQAIRDLHPLIFGIAVGDKVHEGIGLFEGGAFYVNPKRRMKRIKKLHDHVGKFLTNASYLDLAAPMPNAIPSAKSEHFTPDGA